MPAAATVVMKASRIYSFLISFGPFCTCRKWLPACKRPVNENGDDKTRPWGKTGDTGRVVRARGGEFSPCFSKVYKGKDLWLCVLGLVPR